MIASNRSVLAKILVWFLASAIGSFVWLACTYILLASPPMHFFYDALPHAGSKSVYVPGGGFAGFWYHIGWMKSLPNLEDHEYYCFSSGCLSVLLAFSNRTLEEVAGSGFRLQEAWLAGNMSHFDMVNEFFDDLIPFDSSPRDMGLQNMNVLVTTIEDGVQVIKPSSRNELRDSIRKTTWVPYLTGRGILEDANKTWYFDGGFSRMLHPSCSVTAALPLIWDTLVHTFNPGLTKDQVSSLYRLGESHGKGVLVP